MNGTKGEINIPGQDWITTDPDDPFGIDPVDPPYPPPFRP